MTNQCTNDKTCPSERDVNWDLHWITQSDAKKLTTVFPCTKAEEDTAYFDNTTSEIFVSIQGEWKRIASNPISTNVYWCSQCGWVVVGNNNVTEQIVETISCKACKVDMIQLDVNPDIMEKAIIERNSSHFTKEDLVEILV